MTEPPDSHPFTIPPPSSLFDPEDLNNFALCWASADTSTSPPFIVVVSCKLLVV